MKVINSIPCTLRTWLLPLGWCGPCGLHPRPEYPLTLPASALCPSRRCYPPGCATLPWQTDTHTILQAATSGRCAAHAPYMQRSLYMHAPALRGCVQRIDFGSTCGPVAQHLSRSRRARYTVPPLVALAGYYAQPRRTSAHTRDACMHGRHICASQHPSGMHLLAGYYARPGDSVRYRQAITPDRIEPGCTRAFASADAAQSIDCQLGSLAQLRSRLAASCACVFAPAAAGLSVSELPVAATRTQEYLALSVAAASPC